MKRLTIVILVFSSMGTMCQGLKRTFYSFNYKAGFTHNANYYKTSSNPLVTSSYPSWGLGYSGFLLLRKDSVKKIVDFLKVNLYASSKGGYFESQNTTYKLTASSIDLEIILPLRIHFSQDLDLYLGIGPCVSYITKKKSTSIGSSISPPKYDDLQTGFTVELAILSNNLSSFGLRAGSGFGSTAATPLEELSVFIGVSLDDIKKSLTKNGRMK